MDAESVGIASGGTVVEYDFDILDDVTAYTVPTPRRIITTSPPTM
jgi:hypothetical protein